MSGQHRRRRLERAGSRIDILDIGQKAVAYIFDLFQGQAGLLDLSNGSNHDPCVCANHLTHYTAQGSAHTGGMADVAAIGDRRLSGEAVGRVDLAQGRPLGSNSDKADLRLDHQLGSGAT